MSGLGKRKVAAVIAAELKNARSIIDMGLYTRGEKEGRIAALANVAHSFADHFATVKPIYNINGNRAFDRADFFAQCGL